MSRQTTISTPEIRRLWKRDLPEITRHLLHLDTETRRLRFGTYVTDAFLRSYAAGVIGLDSVVFGAFVDGDLRAMGELRGLYRSWPPEAEAAFSVDPAWQGMGIGSTLFARIVTAAQNRGITRLHVLFLHENDRMRRITAKHHADLEFHGGEVEATLDPPWPTPFSIAGEIAENTSAYVRTVFHLSS